MHPQIFLISGEKFYNPDKSKERVQGKMPTYIYVCSQCGYSFERFQKMIDKPVKKCPECKSKVNRLITGGGGILFKGNGFYCTDYRSEQYKEAARKETSVESKETSSSTSSTSGKDKDPS